MLKYFSRNLASPHLSSPSLCLPNLFFPCFPSLPFHSVYLLCLFCLSLKCPAPLPRAIFLTISLLPELSPHPGCFICCSSIGLGSIALGSKWVLCGTPSKVHILCSGTPSWGTQCCKTASAHGADERKEGAPGLRMMLVCQVLTVCLALH